MKALFTRSLTVATLALAGATAATAADPFPSKPIRIIVHSAAGGLLDTTARIVAQKMGDRLGQQMIVENRAGAGGLVGIRSVKAAPADGYTLLVAANTIAIQPAVLQDPGYDLVKDFTGIGPITRIPVLLMVAPDLPARNLAEFLAQAKASPGKLTYASAGNGTSTHLATASFVQRAGLNMVHIPYKGNSAAWPDVISGRVTMIAEPYGTAAPMMREGRLKALGASSSQRLEALPDTPTLAEQGLPGFSAYLWFGLLAPTGTPKDVVLKLSEALRGAITSAELRDRFRNEGSEVMDMAPEEFNHFLKTESAVMSKLVTDLALPKQ
jgi:tripartite-type tricarboxylate transporter receptor subunit TctC